MFSVQSRYQTWHECVIAPDPPHPLLCGGLSLILRCSIVRGLLTGQKFKEASRTDSTASRSDFRTVGGQTLWVLYLQIAVLGTALRRINTQLISGHTLILEPCLKRRPSLWRRNCWWAEHLLKCREQIRTPEESDDALYMNDRGILYFYSYLFLHCKIDLVKWV